MKKILVLVMVFISNLAWSSPEQYCSQFVSGDQGFDIWTSHETGKTKEFVKEVKSRRYVQDPDGLKVLNAVIDATYKTSILGYPHATMKDAVKAMNSACVKQVKANDPDGSKEKNRASEAQRKWQERVARGE